MSDPGRQLREAAAAHRPDRARMLARVERGMARPSGAGVRHRERTAPVSWTRIVLATVATAGALTVGGFAVASVVAGPPGPRTVATGPAVTTSASPDPATAVPPESPTPGRSGPATSSPPTPEPSGTPSGAGSSRPSGPPTTAHATTRPPGGSHTTDGPLWADGSVDPHSTTAWARSNVTLKSATPLTALVVELRIAVTAGVRSAGTEQSLPADDFVVTVHEADGVIVYRWSLKPGRSAPAGQYLFAGQYDHAAGGRDAKDDGYRADATAAGSAASVWGDFAPTG
ncbi:hypothetical protein [Kitasatospora sp. NBC_00315]|uniref:hypothetical protein n=1 Tax=Kitasatospora sp. NBC_00315 TaxID=2975963 RepID=UPI00325049BD